MARSQLLKTCSHQLQKFSATSIKEPNLEIVLNFSDLLVFLALLAVRRLYLDGCLDFAQIEASPLNRLLMPLFPNRLEPHLERIFVAGLLLLAMSRILSEHDEPHVRQE